MCQRCLPHTHRPYARGVRGEEGAFLSVLLFVVVGSSHHQESVLLAKKHSTPLLHKSKKYLKIGATSCCCCHYTYVHIIIEHLVSGVSLWFTFYGRYRTPLLVVKIWSRTSSTQACFSFFSRWVAVKNPACKMRDSTYARPPWFMSLAGDCLLLTHFRVKHLYGRNHPP